MGIRDRDLVPERKKKTRGSIVIAVLLALFAGWGLRMVLHAFLWTPVQVSEPSMAPALKEGDVVTVHRRFEPAEIAKDRMIWFELPMNEKQRMIRRVVAVAGDRVQVKQGAVLVNGKVIRASSYQEEPETVSKKEETDRLKAKRKGPSPALLQASFFDRDEITLKADEFYVLADGDGLDSRQFGPVPVSKVIGLLH